MLCAGVCDGVGLAGVGVTNSNGEYIFTSCFTCLSSFTRDETGVLPAELKGDLVLFVRRL